MCARFVHFLNKTQGFFHDESALAAERGAFLHAEVPCCPPSGQFAEPLLALSFGKGVGGVDAQAVGAPVDLGDPDFDQFDQQWGDPLRRGSR